MHANTCTLVCIHTGIYMSKWVFPSSRRLHRKTTHVNNKGAAQNILKLFSGGSGTFYFVFVQWLMGFQSLISYVNLHLFTSVCLLFLISKVGMIGTIMYPERFNLNDVLEQLFLAHSKPSINVSFFIRFGPEDGCDRFVLFCCFLFYFCCVSRVSQMLGKCYTI